MQERTLGQQGLTASIIGHGSMDSGLGEGDDYDADSIAAIRRAHDGGVTHFDTAELNGWGEGERLLGADFRRRNPWWAPANFEANLEIVGDLTALAEREGVSISQLALAWFLARRPYIVPIPGSRDVRRVAENMAAADLALASEDLQLIDRIAPHGAHV